MSTIKHSSSLAPTVDQRVTDARLGSREALGSLFAACRDYLLVVANQELPGDVRAKVAASDVVQETLLTAQQEFCQFKGGGRSELLLWLRQILLAKLSLADRKYRRTRKRELGRELPLDELDSAVWQGSRLAAAPTDSPSRIAVTRETQDAMARAVAALPMHYQRVILLRSQEHRSFADVGSSLGLTDEGARKLWFRALRRLKYEFGRVR